MASLLIGGGAAASAGASLLAAVTLFGVCVYFDRQGDVMAGRLSEMMDRPGWWWYAIFLTRRTSGNLPPGVAAVTLQIYLGRPVPLLPVGLILAGLLTIWLGRPRLGQVAVVLAAVTLLVLAALISYW